MAAVLGACSLQNDSVEGMAPPDDKLFFPTGLAVDPAGDILYVTNGNADLRYGSSTLLAIDVRRFEELAFAQRLQAPCRLDPEDQAVVECDEPNFVHAATTIHLGNFPGEIRVQEIPIRGAVPTHVRLLLPVRGDPSLTFVDVWREPGSAPRLECSDSGQRVCDTRHRVRELRGRPDQSLPPDPFGIFLDEKLKRLYLTHLSGGEVSLFDVSADPVMVDYRGDFFDPDANGRSGAISVAPRIAGDASSLVYLSSRVSSTVESFVVDASWRIIPGPDFRLASLNPGSDARGMAFDPRPGRQGESLYILDRAPPSLLAIDTTLDEDRTPRNRIRGVVSLCAEPSLLAPHISGDRLLLYAVCFASGQVWVVDADTLSLLAVTDVGSGPHGVAFSESPPRAYVANFADNTIAVLSAEPGSPHQHRVIARIGWREPLLSR